MGQTHECWSAPIFGKGVGGGWWNLVRNRNYSVNKRAHSQLTSLPQALSPTLAPDTRDDKPCYTRRTRSVSPGSPSPRTHSMHNACTCDEGCPCTSHSLVSSCVPRPLREGQSPGLPVVFWSQCGRSHPQSLLGSPVVHQ